MHYAVPPCRLTMAVDISEKEKKRQFAPKKKMHYSLRHWKGLCLVSTKPSGVAKCFKAFCSTFTHYKCNV